MTPPRPHPFARSRMAERFDRVVEYMWERGWDEKPPLEPEYLWKIGSRGFDSADEISIRSEEAVADFRERLEALCKALREEADLNALGHAMAYGQITGAIRKRHALGRIWREEPDLASTPIAPPILVVGQMRSGTTRVQRLLAADPQHSGTRFCNSHDPVPSKPDLRPLKGRFALALARRINPWLDTMHPFGSLRTDEEIGWLAAALSPATFEAQWRIDSFVAFSEGRDQAPIYREFARILRTDAAKMGDAGKPRVLKCPQFAEDLGALLDEFPDARLVVCERDHEEVLASSISMTASQMAFQSDNHDIKWLQEAWARKIAVRQAAMDAALEEFEGPVAHIAFSALNANWRSAIMQAYLTLGMPLPDQSLAAMTAEREKSARDPHGRHATQIANFGSAARA
ncbi:sulfotransferase [Qipengyuania xiapuensis]|uniref:Sulfotransferase n=1 Tax=Qipengyuania xiapuensis TaxID=2867236 RepID=A0ABX8ZTE0_9SPHN|nr:sulfotransferase [Qipengyuania xiapuensis]QZD92276.1 sulfotransferase [Qipengyuania xiapuensis]